MRDQIAFARAMRREPTPGERAFWALLYPWRERGWHWRRQAPIGPYVVDFCCKRAKLIVEIDGDSHYSDKGMARDAVRTTYLAGQGYRVLRFSNVDVAENPAWVFDVMREALGEVDGPQGRTPT
jgi:very-short-patch-repair endonuclease